MCRERPGATLREACHKLEECNVGALAVMEEGCLVGILSERDIIRRAICKGRPMDTTMVADVMTADPRTIDIDGTLSEAQTIMTEGHFRHLPVIENGEPVGILSFRDVPTEYRLMFERFNQYRESA
ncbi:CBS domain protein [Rhodovulum sp. P5]|uniref:CBS domain-containing protein n=1 Tax=Rhodovulum sp. P5 TaxID=1564506 RepID=UPI0009C2B7B8|nr:CBS domain-containing protein [Rhodovulum sp. P5]ARE39756.1 CBS domain protein [Rhodovulum sp. P5]